MQFKIHVFRDVLIYLQDNLSYDNIIYSIDIKVKDYSPGDIAYHIELLADSDFIVYKDASAGSDRYRHLFIYRLTMEGHEFISSIKNDTVWKKVVDTSAFVGVEVVKSTIPILLAYTKTQLGIP